MYGDFQLVSCLAFIAELDCVMCIQAAVKSNAVASLKTIFTQEIFTEQVDKVLCSTNVQKD